MTWAGPIPAPTLTPTSSMPNKYRILVWDTTHHLVAVFTNCRAFDFTDAVNGGSAAGWFRISVDVTTLLAEDTGPVASGGQGNRRSQQYSKQYLSGLAAIAYTVTCDGVSSYTITITGPTGGAPIPSQVVTVTLDNYYRIPITVSDPNGNLSNIATQIAQGINQYAGRLPGSAPNYAATSPGSTVVVTGANVIQQPDGSYDGVTFNAGYVTPAGMVGGQSVGIATYQQAFQYNYRVQFFLEDSINPWYDGRINGWTPDVPDMSTDDAYVTVYTEGWQNALNDGIVTETINPGIQPNGVNNGTITAHAYLLHLLGTYQNTAIFKHAIIDKVVFDLFQLQFQGEGLGQCVNDVVTQVVNQTGHTFEWWVRGLWNVGQGPENSVGVVVQPNCDPMNLLNGNVQTMRIAPYSGTIKRYFVYEVRGQTIFNYQVQNTIINLYNMIALYGGRDPTSQLQVYGPFEDAVSIALYGVRQQRVTNDVLLNKQTLLNYATAYLLLNGYPQPQTTYYKYRPTDAMRAGVWVQVLEQGDGQTIGQTLHQMRAITVECSLQEDQEKMDQIVTAAAPHPFIDKAYYGAIQQSKSTIPVVIDRGGTINPVTYLVSGGDWVDTLPHQDLQKQPNQKVNATVIAPPLGHFGKATVAPDGSHPSQTNPNYKLPLHVSISPPRPPPAYNDKPAIPNMNVPLIDTATGRSGDGAYELDFVTDMQQFAPGSNNGAHGQGVLVSAITGPRSIGGYSLPSGNTGETPQSENMLRLWQFVVLNGAIVGAVDMRTYKGQYAGAPKEAQSIMLTVPAGPNGGGNAHFVYQSENLSKNVPLPNDWYGGFQIGYKLVTQQVILWFCQPGAPILNLPQYWSGGKQIFQPQIYTGDMGWFGSLSGTVTQIAQPPWAVQYNWNPEEQKSIQMRGQPVPISFLTQPKFDNMLFRTDAWKKQHGSYGIKMGPLGSGKGIINQNYKGGAHGGGPFMNWDFPGGLGALITIGVPRIELPVTPTGGPPGANGGHTGALLFYELALTITCTNGNVMTTTRQFTVHNGGNGSVT